MIIQNQIMMQQMKLPIIQKFWNLIFVITTMLNILVRDDITVVAAPATQVAFKNCAQFTKCIIKIYETRIDNTKDLDIVMPMYNLMKSSLKYSETTGVYGFILKMKQLILMLILQTIMILRFPSIRLNY